MRWAIVLRIRVCGMRWAAGAGPDGRGCERSCRGAGRRPAWARSPPRSRRALGSPWRNASTSRRTIRPPGPEPRTWPSSTCDDAATLRASGLAFRRRPPPGCGSSAVGACWPLPVEWLARGGRRGSSPAAACGLAAGRRLRLAQAQRFDDLLGVFTLLGQNHHPLAQRDFIAGGMVDVDDRAVIVRLHRHRGLVGLDVGQRIPFLDLVPDLDQPLRDHAGLHRGTQLGHGDFNRHVLFSLQDVQ